MGNKTARRRGVLATKSRKKARRARDGKHYKIPGFDAFSPHPAPDPTATATAKPGKGKGKGRASSLVPCEEIVEPEKGIHSQAWAVAIIPQGTEPGFLTLPYEVRLKIYGYAIEDFACGKEGIEPRKKGKKFSSLGWHKVSEEATKLALLSRQTYVDFTGSSLLYSLKPFTFASPTLLLNYLCVINPLHRNAIRTIKLHIIFTTHNTTLPTKALNYLSTLSSLQNLHITIHLPPSLCHFSPVFAKPKPKTEPLTAAALMRAMFEPTNTYHCIMSLYGDGKIEKKIKECEGLKSIKRLGLREFELCLNRPKSSYGDLRMMGRSYVKCEVEMEGKLQGMLRELKAEMEGSVSI